MRSARDSCCFSPPTRRPSRRRVASVSSCPTPSSSNRRPQGLVPLVRQPRLAACPMEHRAVSRSPTAASDAAPRVASARRHSQVQVQVYRTRLLLSCTSAVYGGGAGCAPIWPTSCPSRVRWCMRARATRPRPLRFLWGCLARSELTALNLLPPLLCRRPPVPAVLRCLGASTGPSARPCCSGRVARGSSSATQRQRRVTRAACDTHVVAPTCWRALVQASNGSGREPPGTPQLPCLPP